MADQTFEQRVLATLTHLVGALKHISLSGSVQGIDTVVTAAETQLAQAKAAIDAAAAAEKQLAQTEVTFDARAAAVETETKAPPPATAPYEPAPADHSTYVPPSDRPYVVPVIPRT